MKRTVGILAAALAFSAVACDGGPRELKIADGDAKLTAADSAAFLDGLSGRTRVSEADAMKGMLLLLGEEQETTFAKAVATLKRRGVVSGAWDFQADRHMTKGKVAYMIYRACGVRGGVTLTLLGPSQRYCLKELQYQGLMTAGLPYNKVSGMEYVGVLTRADEYRQTGKVSKVLSPTGEAQ